MLHTALLVFRSPYSDTAVIYCKADVECLRSQTEVLHRGRFVLCEVQTDYH